MKALGLEDLRADQSECVHGGCLKLAAPFPAAKACVPVGDERCKTVATATGQDVFAVYRPCDLAHAFGHKKTQALPGFSEWSQGDSNS